MPRAKATPKAVTIHFPDEGLPSAVRVLKLPTSSGSTIFELRWKEPGTKARDTTRFHDREEACREADKLAAELRDGLVPHLGRAARARARYGAAPEVPRPRTSAHTLMDVEDRWAGQFDKKGQSLEGAQYNLKRYVYREYEVHDAFGKPTGDVICLARFDITALKEADIRVWLRSMSFTNSIRGKRFSPSTCDLALRNLNTLLNFAKNKLKWIADNPADGIDVDLYDVKKRDYFEHQDELFQALKHLPDWAKAPVAVLAYTGARFGEGAAFAVSAIDTTNCRIYFERTLLQNGRLSTPKSVSSQDFVPYHPSLNSVFEPHIANLREAGPNDPLFPGQRQGRNLQNSSLNRQLKAACEKAGFDKRVTCHGLRVSLASWLNANNVPISVIQKILRHSDQRTTEGYIRVSETQRADAMATLTALPAGIVTRERS